MSMCTVKSKETEVGWSCDSKKHRLNGTPPPSKKLMISHCQKGRNRGAELFGY